MIARTLSLITDMVCGTGTGYSPASCTARSAMFDSEIADALQLVVDLDDGDDEAQVAGHRLVEGQELEALLLDVDLVLVDHEVGGDHAPGLADVACLDGVKGEAQVVLDERTERQDLALQVLELALQMCGHEPLSPPGVS